MWQGGALRRPLDRTVLCSRALGADASLTEEPGAAMAASAASAALEAAAIETAVAFDAVIAAERRSADCRAFGIGRTRPAEGYVSSTETATDCPTDALIAVEAATALRSSGAAATFVAAAIQSSVAGDPVVIAEDGSPGLAAFTRMGTLSAKSDGPAVTARGAADPTSAK